MITNLKNSFFQTFALTFIWVLLLLSIFTKLDFNFIYIWNIIGISIIAGLVFGVMYNAVWNYLTYKPTFNIIITSILSISSGLLMVWLFSTEMFDFIKPWIIPMTMLSLLMHTITFYFYAKSDSYKKVYELNNLIKHS